MVVVSLSSVKSSTPTIFRVCGWLQLSEPKVNVAGKSTVSPSSLEVKETVTVPWGAVVMESSTVVDCSLCRRRCSNNGIRAGEIIIRYIHKNVTSVHQRQYLGVETFCGSCVVIINKVSNSLTLTT